MSCKSLQDGLQAVGEKLYEGLEKSCWKGCDEKLSALALNMSNTAAEAAEDLPGDWEKVEGFPVLRNRDALEAGKVYVSVNLSEPEFNVMKLGDASSVCVQQCWKDFCDSILEDDDSLPAVVARYSRSLRRDVFKSVCGEYLDVALRFVMSYVLRSFYANVSGMACGFGLCRSKEIIVEINQDADWDAVVQCIGDVVQCIRDSISETLPDLESVLRVKAFRLHELPFSDTMLKKMSIGEAEASKKRTFFVREMLTNPGVLVLRGVPFCVYQDAIVDAQRVLNPSYFVSVIDIDGK